MKERFTSIFANMKIGKSIIEKAYHPAIEAAANYWCNAITGEVSPKKLAKFRKSLLEGIAEIFDSAEGALEIHTETPNLKHYTTFEKPNRPSKILIKAMKKSKLKPILLPQKTSVIISPNEVRINQPETVHNVCSGISTHVIWKSPMMSKRSPR